MKKIFGYLFILMLALNIGACHARSDSAPASTTPEDTPYTGTAQPFLHFTLPDQYNYLTDNPGKTVADEPADLFSTYTLTTDISYEGGALVSVYALYQFVDKYTVNTATPDPDGVLGTHDARKLYSLVVRSNQDGLSNRTKFYDNGTKTEIYNPDLRWDQFALGYLLDLNYTGKTFFPQTLLDPADGGLPKMFNTKYACDVYMFRRIDVKRPDAAGSLATFEVQATTDSSVDDTNYLDSTTLSTTKFTVETKSFGSYTDVKLFPSNIHHGLRNRYPGVISLQIVDGRP
jgi:hypothetical protein